MKSMTTNKQKRGEDGIAAIMIAMFLMIILTLITLGFARIMRREQRQALDSSLSTQAFYAAEAGINDAIKAINAGTFSGDKTTCVDPSFPNMTLSAPLGTSYSCLLIDQTPSDLEYNQGSITSNRSTVMPVEASLPGQRFGKLTVSWGSNLNVMHTFNTCGSTPLPTSASWVPNTGLLRIDLVPVDGTLYRDDPDGAGPLQGLIDGTMSAYLYPSDCGPGGGTVAYASGTANQGRIYQVPCAIGNSPRDCNLTITLPGTVHKYMMRIKSMYKNSNAALPALIQVAHKLVFMGPKSKLIRQAR
jgi:hypothetical protein